MGSLIMEETTERFLGVVKEEPSPPEEFKTLAAIVAGNTLTRATQEVAVRIEKEYKAARGKQIERLHEGFVEVIKNQKPTNEAVIFVLRQMEFQLLQEHHEVHLSPGAEAKRK